jgi:hypothetical protein
MLSFMPLDLVQVDRVLRVADIDHEKSARSIPRTSAIMVPCASRCTMNPAARNGAGVPSGLPAPSIHS